MTTAVQTPAPPHSDFPDWLSPMLVKELRQGMRSRGFVVSFLLLQAAMLVLAVAGLSAPESNDSATVVTASFWMIVGFPLVLVMPMSGLNAIGAEARANTLELIFLTRLTARRILAGKWLAIFAQSALLACTVLPYAVLRYFLGGVDLAREALILAALLGGSAVLSAVTVALSPFPTKVVRALFTVAVVVGMQSFAGLMMMARFGGGPVARMTTPGALWAMWAVPALTVMAFMLEVGASKIAPSAENHSTTIRLIALGSFAAGMLLLRWEPYLAAPTLVVGEVLLAGVSTWALCENPHRPARVYRPFVRWGWAGRLAGRFLYPGWPSGVLFSVLIAVAGLALYRMFDGGPIRHFAEIAALTGVALGSQLMPAAMIQTFWPRVRRPVAAYVGIQVLCVVLYAIASLAQSLDWPDLRPLTRVLPVGSLIAVVSGEGLHSAVSDIVPGVSRFPLVARLLGALIVSAASLLLLLWKMRRPWREIRGHEKTVAGWLAAPPLRGE